MACSMVAPTSASSRRSRLPSMTSSSPATTSSAPRSSGSSRSSRAMSNANGLTETTRSPGPSGIISPNACSRCATAPWLTATGLGRPVEPEVNSTYAVASGGSGTGSGTSGPDPGAAAGSGSDPGGPGGAPARSSSRTLPSSSASNGAGTAVRSVTTTRTPASASMPRSRCGGWVGSSGRYAAPIRQAPSSAGSARAPRGRMIPTVSWVPTPSARSPVAIRPTSPRSALPVRVRSSPRITTRSPASRSATSRAAVLPGGGNVPVRAAGHTWVTSSRVAGESTSTSPTRVSGAVASVARVAASASAK